MWIRTANKFAKFYAKRLNQSENLPKSFRGLLFSETPCTGKQETDSHGIMPNFSAMGSYSNNYA